MFSMIPSLRLRFFLIVWPLVVGSVVGVGWWLGRWNRVEIRREALVQTSDHDGFREGVVDGVADALSEANRWSDVTQSLRADSGWNPAGDPERLLVLIVDADGEIRARSDDGVRFGRTSVDSLGVFSAGMTMVRGGEQLETRVRIQGASLPPIGGPEAPRPLWLVVMPESLEREFATAQQPGGPSVSQRFVARADRAIVLSVLVASGFAALATLWLAQLVLGPSYRLAEAARRIRSGDLSTRVDPVPADELGQVAEAFNRMAEELEQSEGVKRRMVSDAAHELRTPLTNIAGTVEAIEDGLVAPDESTIRSIGQEAAVLERIVQDLQDIAMADAGALHLKREWVDLRAAAEQAIASFAALLRRRDVAVVVVGEGRAWVDPVRTDQIVRNLLHNAISHSPSGGTVQVDLVERGEQSFSVRDDGPGIAAEHLPLVWERFYRVEGSRDRQTGGTGLGLAIVKRLVEAHGGEVHVRSVQGHGSEFWVRFAA